MQNKGKCKLLYLAPLPVCTRLNFNMSFFSSLENILLARYVITTIIITINNSENYFK